VRGSPLSSARTAYAIAGTWSSAQIGYVLGLLALLALLEALLYQRGAGRLRRWPLAGFVVLGCVFGVAGALFVARQPASASAEPEPALGDLIAARDVFLRHRVGEPPAATPATPAALRARQSWLATPRLGLFIHYGPSTLLEARSDRQWWHRVQSSRIRSAAAAFHPNLDHVDQWVVLAKRLGASYLTVTAKHHDGFALWRSDLSRWSVGRNEDVIRRVSRDARKAHLKLFLYYSLLDLHEVSYDDPHVYRRLVLGQLRELLTRYGPIGGIWLDGWSERFSDRDLEEIYALVHTLQPTALVATNHHRQPLKNEDFQIFESAFPGDRSPKRLRTPVSGLHHEVAMKLAQTWFWSPSATMSNERMNRLIERAERRRESLLLDIPPRGDASFDPTVWRLAARGLIDP
jgi:hypothetical protein